MKKFALFLFILVFAKIGISQDTNSSVFSSSGYLYSDGATNIYWTIGEAIVETISDGTTTLTQGFHQENYGALGGNSLKKNDENYLVEIFPNPTSNYVNCQISHAKEIKSVSVNILDIRGNLLRSNTFTGLNNKFFSKKIVLDNLSAGEYIFQFQNKEFNKSLKVIKK